MALRNPFRKAPDDAAADGVADDGLTDDADGEWLAYELHTWASQSRLMLDQLLLADGVAHSWQGTTLLAHESLEEQVDALIEEVEQSERREIDPERPLVAFEMAEWSGELQAALADRLGATGIPHEFDADGDLICHEDDEEHVEIVIEELMARAGDQGLEQLDGLEANDLLSRLFESVDRLRRDVHDSKGLLGALEHGPRLVGSATPFGFSPAAWSGLRDAVSELCDLLGNDARDDDTDEEIADRALRLRDTLHQLI